jgi:hypothetical protein
MANKLVITTLFLFSFLLSNAQTETTESSKTDIFQKIEEESQGRITFEQEDSIHNLVLKHIANNRHKDGIPGYRIRVYSNLGTNARQESQEIRSKFYEEFPDIPVYREYDSPYFKVYVGDFRTKIEAIKSLKQIKRLFPAAFVVPDQINYPELN